MSEQPNAKPANNIVKVILTIVVALVVVCIVLPICVIAVLALMGPNIANIFSKVTSGMTGTFY